MQDTRPSRSDIIDGTILLLIILISTSIRINKLDGYASTDDGIYIASCWLIKQGYRPYQDFTLVQPPLYFWLTTFAWRIFDLQEPYTMWAIAKSISLLSFFATTILIYLTCRNRLGNRYAGLAGSILYQVSYSNYVFSVSTSPQLLTTFLLTLSVYLTIQEEPEPRDSLIGGIALGLAVITRFSALYLIPVILTFHAMRIRKMKNGKRMMLMTILGLIIPLPALLTIPFNALTNDLIMYHLTKSPTEVSLDTRVASMISDLLTKEVTCLIGIIAAIYSLYERDPRKILITISAFTLLGPYILQPTTTSQHLIEATPFFAVTAATALTAVFDSKGEKERRKLSALTVCLLIILTCFLPNPILQISEARESHPESRVMRKLAHDIQLYSREDEMVFSQLTVVPFLARRQCPPLADIDWVNKQLGLFTSETVRQLVLLYPLKVIIITHRIEAEIRDFLGEEGYVRVNRIQNYRVYVRN